MKFSEALPLLEAGKAMRTNSMVMTGRFIQLITSVNVGDSKISQFFLAEFDSKYSTEQGRYTPVPAFLNGPFSPNMYQLFADDWEVFE